MYGEPDTHTLLSSNVTSEVACIDKSSVSTCCGALEIWESGECFHLTCLLSRLNYLTSYSKFCGADGPLIKWEHVSEIQEIELFVFLNRVVVMINFEWVFGM